jgi:hypothetical protein
MDKIILDQFLLATSNKLSVVKFKPLYFRLSKSGKFEMPGWPENGVYPAKYKKKIRETLLETLVILTKERKSNEIKLLLKELVEKQANVEFSKMVMSEKGSGIHLNYDVIDHYGLPEITYTYQTVYHLLHSVFYDKKDRICLAYESHDHKLEFIVPKPETEILLD